MNIKKKLVCFYIELFVLAHVQTFKHRDISRLNMAASGEWYCYHSAWKNLENGRMCKY